MPDSKPDQREPKAADGGAGNLRSGVQGVGPTEFVAPSDVTDVGDGWLGRVIDERYEVTEVLGEGGMGAVFVARHLKLHKEVALKVVRSELAGNGEVAARFAREAMATAQFEHPHVASAIDFGTLPEGGAYFVMQRVRGESLRAVLMREGKLPWRRACELAAQVADALSAASANGIVHRDLKPENMLVEQREDGSELLRILDFGIAHVAPTDRPAPEGALAGRTLTRVGTVMGTPGYMSPEQAVGDRIDHRTDLYALGVILWECVAGRLLWDGPDLTSVISQQLTKPVPTLASMQGCDAPAALDSLIAQLTARAAAERPERAGPVRDELRRLAVSEPSRLSLERVLPLDDLRGSFSAWRSDPRAKARDLVASYLRKPLRQRVVLTLTAVLFALCALWFASSGDDDPKNNTATTLLPTPAAALQKVTEVLINPIPEDLRPHVDTMKDSDRMLDRRKAAQAIVDYPTPDKLEPYLLTLAKLEAARSCSARREAIQAMGAAPDDRFLPALERLSRSKTTGCGFLRLGDCFGCIRGDLRRAIAAIEAD